MAGSAAAHAAGLRAVGLACVRGRRRLFEGLQLHLRPGELVWLRADNGRGKTSLLRLLAGLATPDAGEVLLDGRPVREATRLGLGPVYVGHASALKDDASAGEALLFLARLQGRSVTPLLARQALDRLGLARSAEALVRTLSQGQRRRIALARLALELSLEPSHELTHETQSRPWILDEPYDALDATGQAALDGLLTEHLARDGSVILTSHQPLAPTAPAATCAWLGRKGLESPA